MKIMEKLYSIYVFRFERIQVHWISFHISSTTKNKSLQKNQRKRKMFGRISQFSYWISYWCYWENGLCLHLLEFVILSMIFEIIIFRFGINSWNFNKFMFIMAYVWLTYRLVTLSTIFTLQNNMSVRNNHAE